MNQVRYILMLLKSISRISLLNILIIGLGLLCNHCQCTCSEYPTYTLTDKDKEWVCYKEGQILKFVSNLGNVREYKVTGLTDHMIEVKEQPRSHTAITFRSCPELKYQEVYCQLVNINAPTDIFYWYLTTIYNSDNQFKPNIWMFTTDVGLGLPIKYINENESTFTDSTVTPIIYSVYLSKAIIANKEYKNVYKTKNEISNWFYSKEYGLLSFKRKNEIWEISN